LTSSAQNDAAVGRFVGFLSTLLLVCEAGGLAEKIQPSSSNIGPNMALLLLLALPAGFVVWAAFRWPRPRFPDFARGYRSGSLIVAVFFGVIFVWGLLR